MLKNESLDLSKALIRCASITPIDNGALGVLEEYLKSIGFECSRITFSESNTPDVENLYARLGSTPPNLCFAGHTDVVPIGDRNKWDSDPFTPTIKNGQLHGRGAADMKCAIAAFAAATRSFCKLTNNNFCGSISFLITGDEEGPAINGTTKMLDWLKSKGETLDDCIVGEPTSEKKVGDIIKIGRRGSLNANVSVFGNQGHVAYPDKADNPIGRLLTYLTHLDNKVWDNGTQYFQPSNLEITSVDVGNATTNIIPAKASAKLNIRFNNLHTGEDIKKYLIEKQRDIIEKSRLDIKISGESFLTTPGNLTNLIINAIKEVTNINAQLSTSGGTSDARFIKDFCPVSEFGMLNTTAHKINEHVSINDLTKLAKIYENVLRKYFVDDNAINI